MEINYDRYSSVPIIDDGIRNSLLSLEPEGLQLKDLTGISPAEIPDPVAGEPIVSRIARLLLRRNDRESLEKGLAVSFLLHGLERAQGRGHAASCLLKGLTQIGLGDADIGVKNIIRARSMSDAAQLSAQDSMLASWGLVSAALFHRDIKLARHLVGDWRSEAKGCGLKGEAARATLAEQLLDSLAGIGECTAEDMVGRVAQIPVDGAPPLFLGVSVLPVREDAALDELSTASFADLCRARAAHTDDEAQADLSLSDLKTLEHLLEAWDLAGPLDGVLGRIRSQTPEAYFESLTSRLLGRRVWEHMERFGVGESEGAQRKEAVIWLTDVRGYSTLSESTAPEVLFEALSPIFRIMNEELEEAGGMILEFVGDSILVVFGAIEGQVPPASVVLSRTARCLERLHAFGAMATLTGRPLLRIGVGINRGEVAVGHLGGLGRCHLATLGNTVNVAARIESLTRKLPSAVAVEEALFSGSSPDMWADPFSIDYTLRRLGAHRLKGIGRPSQIYGLAPLIPYWVDFVPMGFVAAPEPGVVYLDVGNRCEPGVIDHHTGLDIGDSACEVINSSPRLVLSHLRGVRETEIEFRLHTGPDLDCAASFYSACEWLAGYRAAESGAPGRVRVALLRELARYVSQIDQGRFPDFDHHLDSLYGVFQAHCGLLGKRLGRRPTDRELLGAGLRVIDAAMFLAESAEGTTDFARVFEAEPEWFAEEREWLRGDRDKYLEDRARGETYEAAVGGADGRLLGLWLTRPESKMFKSWARNDPDAPGGKGYPWLVVDWTEKGEAKFIFSVEPDSGLHLRGLGQALEAVETEKRKKMEKPRPETPKRFTADNSDPWYFGQGHGYTIVDVPGCGTVLSKDEVIGTHRAWKPDPD